MTTQSHLPIVPGNVTLTCDIQRGPNWLFIRLHPLDANTPPRSASLWARELFDIANRHFVYRLVIELDDLPQPPEELADALEMLHPMLTEHGGALRLCGMSPACERRMHHSLHGADDTDLLHNHTSRRAAVRSE